MGFVGYLRRVILLVAYLEAPGCDMPVSGKSRDHKTAAVAMLQFCRQLSLSKIKRKHCTQAKLGRY
jgi:hypothetical protein